jgi:hypothetical protein
VVARLAGGRAVAVLAAIASVLGGPACGAEEDVPPVPTPSPTPVVFRGDARLDGAPFDAEFLGAAVLEHGLVTPCQAEIPPIDDGRFSIAVHSSDGGLGCGRPGAQVLLWTHVVGDTHWALDPIEWPADGRDEVDLEDGVEFRTSDPDGSSPEVAQFHGAVVAADGEPLPVGTEVEAFVGEARCGVASVRRADSFLGYVISVVGPASVPGCTRGASIQLRVGGDDADHNPIVNTPPGERDAIDLRRRR